MCIRAANDTAPLITMSYAIFMEAFRLNQPFFEGRQILGVLPEWVIEG